jgi:hypothetical protein
METSDLDVLLRWETAGGTWRLDDRRGDPATTVTVTLCRCDGGEELERIVSDAPDLIAYVEAHADD